MANTLSDTVIHSQPLAAVRPWQHVWKRWGIRIVLLFVFLWLASVGLSLLIRHSRLQRKLTTRLESVFGRRVEVGRYSFSLWGPVLEAESVTFGEDPRFGQEYFLRAESLTVRLRWLSLFRGHLELGTVSLVHPSLNLVRNEEGDWNLAEWLPRPANASPTFMGPPAVTHFSIRFSRIEVDSGRINFKRSDEKLPFALVDVSGYVEPESPGRWKMDLEATPMRAAVIVQQAGILRLSGHLGGTSSRLRPAALDISWSDASVSDLLRLAHSYDYGVRGLFSLAVNAHTSERDDGWTIQSSAQFTQLHRWDLTLRSDTPSINVFAKTHWNLGVPEVDLTDVSIEALHSQARGSAKFAWGSLVAEVAQKTPPVSFEVVSSMIDLNDLLAWDRAFHPDVADDISLSGFVSARGSASGWPLRVANAAVMIGGAELSGARLRVPARLGNLEIHYDHAIVSIAPVSISFGPSENSIRMESASARAKSRELPGLHAVGNLLQVRDLIASASALGWNVSRGWNLGGPVRFDLLWPGTGFPWQTQPTGSVELGGLSSAMSLHTPFLNRPILGIKGHADWKPDSRHIALSSADAFGAHWSGSLDREKGAGWQFVLSTDHLAAADLDRSLNPQWRESFLDRMLPFLNSISPANAVADTLSARGRITLDQFVLTPVVVHHLQGDLNVEGRHIEFANVTGQFYGGSVGGKLDANLVASPSYRMVLDYSHVDLKTLSAASPVLANLFGGSVSGELLVTTRGANHSDLMAALTCKGRANVSNAELRNLNLADSLRAGVLRPGTSSFQQASADFTCADREIKFQDLVLSNPSREINGSGTIDFAHNLDFRLRAATENTETPKPGTADPANAIYQLKGPISAPQFSRIEAPPPNP